MVEQAGRIGLELIDIRIYRGQAVGDQRLQLPLLIDGMSRARLQIDRSRVEPYQRADELHELVGAVL